MSASKSLAALAASTPGWRGLDLRCARPHLGIYRIDREDCTGTGA
jgi:hypothetical protein